MTRSQTKSAPFLRAGTRLYCFHTSAHEERLFLSWLSGVEAPLVVVTNEVSGGLLHQALAERPNGLTQFVSHSSIGLSAYRPHIAGAVRNLGQVITQWPNSHPPCHVLMDMAWLMSTPDLLGLLSEFEACCGQDSAISHAAFLSWIDATAFSAEEILNIASFFPEVLVDNEIIESPEIDGSSGDFSAILLERTLKALKELQTLKRLLNERSASLRHAESALNTLNCLLDSMGEGVLVTDMTGKIILFNRRAEQIMGYGILDLPLEERVRAYGNYLPDKVTPYPINDLPIVRAMRGEDVDEAEIFIKNPERPDGVWVSVTTRPLRDAQGKITGGISVFRDITHRKAQQAAETVPE